MEQLRRQSPTAREIFAPTSGSALAVVSGAGASVAGATIAVTGGSGGDDVIGSLEPSAVGGAGLGDSSGNSAAPRVGPGGHNKVEQLEHFQCLL